MNQKPEVWHMGFRAYEKASNQSENAQTENVEEGVYLGRLNPGTRFATAVKRKQKQGLRTSLSFQVYGSIEEYNALLNTEVDSVVIVDPFSVHSLDKSSIYRVCHTKSLEYFFSEASKKGKASYLFVPQFTEPFHYAYAQNYLKELEDVGLEGIVFGGREEELRARDFRALEDLNYLVERYGKGAKMGFYAHGDEKVELNVAKETLS